MQAIRKLNSKVAPYTTKQNGSILAVRILLYKGTHILKKLSTVILGEYVNPGALNLKLHIR